MAKVTKTGIRNRNLGVRRVLACDLVAHPLNWRQHPKAQQDALRGVLSEVGFVGTLLAYELPDGRLQLIDGHLRTETIPGEEVDVMVVDLSPDEAAKVLATHDPLAAMAEADAGKLDELLREVQTGDEALAKMLEELATDAGVLDGMGGQVTGRGSRAAGQTCEPEGRLVDSRRASAAVRGLDEVGGCGEGDGRRAGPVVLHVATIRSATRLYGRIQVAYG